MNGHKWLAAKLTKRRISYVLRENAFLSIDNFAKAQEFSDSIQVSDLHRALDGFAKKYCPVFQEYGLAYHYYQTRKGSNHSGIDHPKYVRNPAIGARLILAQ